MDNIAKFISDQKASEIVARILFALVFVMFGVGKFNIDDANELAGLVVYHPVLKIFLKALGPLGFAVALGIIEISIAMLIFSGIKSPKLGFIGAGFAVGAFIVTTSIILFAPVFRETAGFPFGNFTGLFLFKDLGLLSCALLLLQVDARRIVRTT